MDSSFTQLTCWLVAGICTCSERGEWDTERSGSKSRGVRWATPGELDACNSDSWFDSVSAGTSPRVNWVSLEKLVEEQGTSPAPFGPELADDLQVVSEAMPSPDYAPKGQMIAHYGPYASMHEPANVIAIPGRIDAGPMSDAAFTSLSPTQRTIADCLYSRNHDGHVRQRHLKRIVAVEELWVIPYVVVAIGDYVVEVVKEVAAGLRHLDQAHSWQDSKYRLFADHNADLIDLMRQRAASYWDCYYSKDFSFGAPTEQRPRYPSLEILDSIGQPGHRMLYRSQSHR